MKGWSRTYVCTTSSLRGASCAAHELATKRRTAARQMVFMRKSLLHTTDGLPDIDGLLLVRGGCDPEREDHAPLRGERPHATCRRRLGVRRGTAAMARNHRHVLTSL